METIVEAHGLKFKPMISEEAIKKRVEEIASQIAEEYSEKCPLLLGVLNGAFVFAADLIRAMNIDCDNSFIKLASYRRVESTGQVSTVTGLEEDVKNRGVIIVEDIIDSGKTLSSFIPGLKAQQPASVKLVALLVKPDAIKYPIQIDYRGFDIPPAFVIGYGLDYNGLARNLKGIYQLAD